MSADSVLLSFCLLNVCGIYVKMAYVTSKVENRANTLLVNSIDPFYYSTIQHSSHFVCFRFFHPASYPLTAYPLYWTNVLPISESWPLCFLYMLGAAALFLFHQLRRSGSIASLSPFSHSTSLFPPPSSLTWYHLFLLILFATFMVFPPLPHCQKMLRLPVRW